jgi:hypothetical protein
MRSALTHTGRNMGLGEHAVSYIYTSRKVDEIQMTATERWKSDG